jgi:CRISPR-associated protein Cmr5
MPAEVAVKRISQRRAEFALQHVRNLASDVRNGFRDKVKGAPAMILQNGLGAALAFMLGKDDHKEVALAVLAWLKKEGILQVGSTNMASADLIRGINGLSLNDYLRAQREALEVLGWLKRYADAELWS